MTEDEQRQHFKEWEARRLRFTDRDAVDSRVGFTLRLPKASAVASIAPTYYTSPGMPPHDQRVWVLYGDIIDGVLLLAEPDQEKPDFAAWVSRAKLEREAGNLKSDTVPDLVSIGGFTGWGSEPGVNTIQGVEHPRPGYVSWWENGVRYSLYGAWGRDGTRRAELISIANSMYE